MTVIALSVTPGGVGAMVATDTQVFSDGAHCGHRSKLGVNVAAHAVLVYAGPLAARLEADDEFGRALNLDQAIDLISGRLRGWAGDTSADGERSPRPGPAAVLVGYSPRRGTITAFVLDAARNFEPVETRRYLSPDIPGRRGPADVHDAISIGQEQIEALRRGAFPSASGGLLTFAEITFEAIRVRSVFDFRVDAMTTRPKDLTRPVVMNLQGAAARPSASPSGPLGGDREEHREPADGPDNGLPVAAGNISRDNEGQH